MNGITDRTEPVREILTHLSQGDWCAVFAPKNGGKSTLAGQLEFALKYERPDWTVIRITMRKTGTIEPVWLQIESRMIEEPNRGHPSGTNIAAALAKILSVSAQTYCLILDNLDVLPDEVLRLLGAELRKFHDHPEYAGLLSHIHCVFFGALKLLYLTREPSWPLYNMTAIVNLPGLTPEQTARTFSERLGGVTLSKEAQKTLYLETAGHLYLINTLVQRLRGATLQPSAQDLSEAADYWSRKSVDLQFPDSCLDEVIRYLENQKRAFEVVMMLLEKQVPPPAPVGDADPALMCSALTVKDDLYNFRGLMFERAFRFYLDDLRKADYYCLHGDWEHARHFYERVTPSQVQARRIVGFGLSKRRITDLFQGLTPVFSNLRTLTETEEFVVQSGFYLFGANRAQLWRLDDGTGPARVVASAGNPESQPPSQESQNLAIRAALEHKYLILCNNGGIIIGIGIYPPKTRWALELHYKNGVEEWVKDNLQYLEPTFYMILNAAGRG